MDIGVLGPLVARAHGMSVAPTAGKPRQILALLALHPGQVVTASALMEEVWGEDLPRSASTTLQSYIRQLRCCLRRALAVAGKGDVKDVLATRHGGYLLDIDPECVDVAAFERLVASGRAAWSAGDLAAAAGRFADALAIWRGPALVDVSAGRLLEVQLLRLDEMRLAALEARIAADLELGRHAELLGELAALSALHPTYENIHAMHMLALHRAGRTGDALEAFHRLRGMLVEQLGVEPAPQVQRLLQSILSADPQLRRHGRADGPLPVRLVG
ncbi:AfsR/SARP family transcriptional regulator [Streptomyces sp. LHD-70]|uniref:AfsR/SARP family transcriptional regulator n=1 Tax=Streptomyces sp. LHD-70 TaxID=3072140 RepID=UPI00280D15E0|nr:AfsR/SARP family transcriptional regulator [Streptomyces sp. LHD-70]MDQ8705970.1 AfsR/SARP family transcriptional regulator [Streptomyces sp. LHD-70]